MPNDLYPATAAEQLQKWDAGECIYTIEMGGLGPGYEQAIQILAIEIVRDNVNENLGMESLVTGWADSEDAGRRARHRSTVARCDQKDENGQYYCGGFSGAQVGAAKWLAYQWLTIGPRKLMGDPKLKERHIMASNFWLRVPK